MTDQSNSVCLTSFAWVTIRSKISGQGCFASFFMFPATSTKKTLTFPWTSMRLPLYFPTRVWTRWTPIYFPVSMCETWGTAIQPPNNRFSTIWQLFLQQKMMWTTLLKPLEWKDGLFIYGKTWQYVWTYCHRVTQNLVKIISFPSACPRPRHSGALTQSPRHRHRPTTQPMSRCENDVFVTELQFYGQMGKIWENGMISVYIYIDRCYVNSLDPSFRQTSLSGSGVATWWWSKCVLMTSIGLGCFWLPWLKLGSLS